MGVAKEYWDKLTAICKKHPKGRPYDDKGQFYPDPTPVAPPIGQEHVADIDMFEIMKRRIRNEASIAAQMEGLESFEEADDFMVDDDFEPFSPWEEITEQFRPDGPVLRPEQPNPPENGDGGAKAPGSPNQPAPPPPVAPASTTAGK